MMRTIQKALTIFGVLVVLYCCGSLLYGVIVQKLDSWRFDNAVVSAAPAEPSEGEIVGRLEIPDLKFSVMVLEGVGDEVLTVGAGHVPGTAVPGSRQAGNIAIAGHRDTFFRELRKVGVGQRIRLTTLEGAVDYFVSGTEVVRPSDTAVLNSRGVSELTLITCYPFTFIGSAPDRFVVHATVDGSSRAGVEQVRIKKGKHQ